MNEEHDLPESAKRAFDSYKRIEPTPAFNRAVLESLAGAQSKRRQTLVGRLEEFLGVGLWSFAASGALGALFPAVVLSTLLLSGSPQQHAVPSSPEPTTWPGWSPFGQVYRREHDII